MLSYFRTSWLLINTDISAYPAEKIMLLLSLEHFNALLTSLVIIEHGRQDRAVVGQGRHVNVIIGNRFLQVSYRTRKTT